MEEFSWLVKFLAGLLGTCELNLLLPAFTLALKFTPGLALVSAVWLHLIFIVREDA